MPLQITFLANFLASVPKLKQFQRTTILELAREMKTVELKAGSLLFEQGDQADSYYVLVTGICALHIREEGEEGLGENEDI